MKKIDLTQDRFTLVDDEDYDFLNQWKWYYHKGYAIRASSRQLGKQKKIYMHRVILDTPMGLYTDHINNNTLDNRRNNLRICNTSQNCMNRSISKANSSGYKGVCWNKTTNLWQAQIYINQQLIYLGCFKEKENAAIAYNKAAIQYYGEFAKLNKVEHEK